MHILTIRVGRLVGNVGKMSIKTLTAQDVNGDPFVSGGNINIINGSTTSIIFTEVDDRLGDPISGETVSLDGGVTQLNYTLLGFGDVRGDALQGAGFIRVDMGDGTFQTFAIDMNADGDELPDLATGNTKLTVAALDSTTENKFPSPACFTAGTMIQTDQGPKRVETLKPGDQIQTLDSGFQELQWLGQSDHLAFGNCAPVFIQKGALGNDADLIVSQHHGMLIQSAEVELFFGEVDVLVAAKFLVNGKNIRLIPGGTVTYYHLMLQAHEIVIGGGIPSESYQGEAVNSQQQANAAVGTLMSRSDEMLAVRPRLRQFEARLLAA